MTPERLMEAASRAAIHGSNEIVEGWLRPSSRNLFVGDSGIGKSPLLLQLALCVASGKEFLGRAVCRGRVLHLMFEAEAEAEFRRSVERMLKHLGLEWPDEYFPWSPSWDTQYVAPPQKPFTLIKEAVADVVVIDPLRPHRSRRRAEAGQGDELFQEAGAPVAQELFCHQPSRS